MPRRFRVVPLCALAILVLTTAGCGGPDAARPNRQPGSGAGAPSAATAPADPSPPTRATGVEPGPGLAQGGRTIFPRYRVVAYYGTAGTAGLGVLGSKPPDEIVAGLRSVAARYATPGRTVVPAFELIVTVADSAPGADGDYSHPIDRAAVRRYVDVARRNGLLVVLDIQPGRGAFLPAVRQWREFLEQPHVGLALDSEWRMRPGQVPGTTVGQVRAGEVNQVSAYLSRLVDRDNLPNKLFVLHTFREDMLLNESEIQRRPGLAMVEQLDGFGGRELKLHKYRKLQRPERFHMGFKLFYDQDTDLLRPREVLDLQPSPEYISYQ